MKVITNAQPLEEIGLFIFTDQILRFGEIVSGYGSQTSTMAELAEVICPVLSELP